jgi:hypothetical protein
MQISSETPRDAMSEFENVLLHRGIIYRKAVNWPFSWWEQAIYTEKINAYENLIKVSYYNPEGDVEKPADTLFTVPCVFYIDRDSIITLNGNIVELNKISFDYGNGMSGWNKTQIVKFNNEFDAERWIHILMNGTGCIQEYEKNKENPVAECFFCKAKGVLEIVEMEDENSNKLICEGCIDNLDLSRNHLGSFRK